MHTDNPTFFTSAGTILVFSLLASCANNSSDKLSIADIKASKVASAITCSNGLTIADSTIYAHGGGTDFAPTIMDKSSYSGNVPPGMIYIQGGEFSMGGVNPVGITDGGKEHMNDARPVHRVKLDPFLIDATEVTNAQFAAFVKATGYITIAEQTPTREEFPTAPPENLVAGSVVFSPPPVAVELKDFHQWWAYIQGANWQHPEGAGSSITGKDSYPVVHIAWEDAYSYAEWAGKRLPTEAEWEYAARGGEAGNLYSWGNQMNPDGKWMANTFQGNFPNADMAKDGYKGIAPVKSFSPNNFGIYDLAGNVWEWTSDWYSNEYYQELKAAGIAVNPKGPKSPNDPEEPGVPKKVHRGGSYLCTDQYCTRYMVGTRGKGEWRSATNHLGFRCVKSLQK